MSAFITAGTALGITAMLCLSASRGWRGWLDLRRFEIAAARDSEPVVAEVSPALRIEMAALKERLKKLEAIATGVDP